MQAREVASQHDADLVGEDLVALVVDDPAAVAVAVEAEPDVGPDGLDLLGHGFEHVKVFGVRVVAREGEIGFGVERHHLAAERFEESRRESARRSVAAGRHNLQLSRDRPVLLEVGQVAGREIRDRVIGAAFGRCSFAAENEVAELRHLVRAESDRTLPPHLDAGPAVVVMRRRHHGDGRNIELELREIGHGREREPDIVNPHAARHQSERQRMFDRGRIGPVIVARHDVADTVRPEHGGEAKPQGLSAEKVQFLREKPPRIVFAKARGLDHGLGFGGETVGVQAGNGLHGGLRR